MRALTTGAGCAFALVAGCVVEDGPRTSGAEHPVITSQSFAGARRNAERLAGAIACWSGPTVRGMDVASYDTIDDWTSARTSGIEFVFVRVSDGTQYPDPEFATHWARAKGAGMLRGAYQYFRPAEDPIAQADLLLAQIGTPDPDDLPPVLDLEVSGGLAPDAVISAVRTWLTRVGTAIGRPPIVYAGLYSWPELTGGADVTTSPLWVAQYTSAPCPDVPRPWTDWQFWQTTATGSAPGVANPGTLDLDVFAGTREDLIAFASAAPRPCGTLAPAGGVIDDGDPCFVAGGPPDYLRQVTTAGYDGDVVWTHATDATSESNFAQWNLVLAAPGRYLVEAYTDPTVATSRRATYAVRASGATSEVTLDQSAAAGWRSLGTFDLAAGGDQWIHLSDNTGEPATAQAQLAFDAIRLTGNSPQAGSGLDGGLDPPADVPFGCSASGTTSPLLLVLALALVLVPRRGGAALLALVHRLTCAQGYTDVQGRVAGHQPPTDTDELCGQVDENAFTATGGSM
jgi:lysozyme